jgi:hypothetical protein
MDTEQYEEKFEGPAFQKLRKKPHASTKHVKVNEWKRKKIDWSKSKQPRDA